MTGTQLRRSRQQFGLSQAKLAELTGIPQHLLSAFELEKTDLPPALLIEIAEALSNVDKVASVAKRVKRYRESEYVTVKKLPERISKAHQTSGNAIYTDLLKDLARSHSSAQRHQFSAISLFSGCGGFSLGFSAAGFKIKGFLELEEDLREIYKLNFPDSEELGGDITTVTEESLRTFAARLGPVDAIIGGPPCQGFSLSGKREVTDPRNQLFKHYLRFVDAFQPKVAILENVRLLTSMKNSKGGFVRDEICSEFRGHNYKVKNFEINAKHYGVPQHRERVLFVAVRNDLAFDPSIPAHTHRDEALNYSLFASFPSLRTFGDACSDLPYIESGEKSDVPHHEAVKHPAHVIDWLWDVPQGFSAHDNRDEAKRPPSGYNTTYKRQVWNEPASTVQTTFGMISGCRNVHPIATRSLTVREAARIQSFPDEYQFRGSLGAIRTGIGNAVPPLLGYHLARHFQELI